MIPIKRRFYYDSDGHIFFELNLFNNSTIEKDIADFTELSERNRETFDVLELPFGAYAQDFAESNGYRVNVETRELEFSYPNPNDPIAEPVYQKPLTEQILELKQNQIATNRTVDSNSTTQQELLELLIDMGVI